MPHIVGIVLKTDVPDNHVVHTGEREASQGITVQGQYGASVNCQRVHAALVPIGKLGKIMAFLSLFPGNLDAGYLHIPGQTVRVCRPNRVQRILSTGIVIAGKVAADKETVANRSGQQVQYADKDASDTFGGILTLLGSTTHLPGKSLQNLYGITALDNFKLNSGLFQQVQDADKGTSDTFGGILTVLGSTAYLCRQFLQCPKRIVSFGRLE